MAGRRALGILGLGILSASAVMAQAAHSSAPDLATLQRQLEELRQWTDLLWTCLAAFLVFFMQAGFALVETGFTRAKNAVNILMKNLMDFCLGSLGYWLVGFGLMFGATNGLFGTTDFGPQGPDPSAMTFWLFQAVFAATAATIVSGAMAERTRFGSYLCYSVVITAFIYPIFGSWAWGGLYHGGGWLEHLNLNGSPEGTPFIDFAGSTVVHSVGGWAALMGALILGPRLGKFGPDGQPRAIPGHNLPLAALGVFILWFGWFGFNPGSTTSITGGSFAIIAVTTNLSAAAGCVVAMCVAWLAFGKPDASMTLNGALAGLVAITASCANVSPAMAIVIGGSGGALAVGAVVFFDHVSVFGRRIDDPVGAISVHGVGGAWGTLAAGLFAQEAYGGVNGLLFGGGVSQLLVQCLGIAACFVWTVTTTGVLFWLLHRTIGLRVSEVEELEGLDVFEHGQEAYGDLGLATGSRHADELAQAAR